MLRSGRRCAERRVPAMRLAAAAADGGCWRRRADSNRRIGVLQTPALTTWLRRLDGGSHGAEEEIRTPTALRPQRPQRCVSTNSTTSACRGLIRRRQRGRSGHAKPRPSIIAKILDLVHISAAPGPAPALRESRLDGAHRRGERPLVRGVMAEICLILPHFVSLRSCEQCEILVLGVSHRIA